MQGCTDHPKRPSHRNHKPAADGTAGEPYQGFAHEPLTFDGSRSYDTDGRIISWRWNFGDGTIGTGETITHAYDQAGNYTVTLTVTDNWYAADVYTSSAYITIGNNPSSTPLISGPTFGHANILYQYTVLSTDPDKDTLLYVVDWGDGASSTSPLFGSGHIITTTHQWTKNGFYMVRVYALDRNYASSNVYELVVAIDVQYVKDLGYLLDKNSDGIFDVFHSNITVKETKINLRQSGYYYIDTDGDERWDIVYDPVSHQLQTYHETPLLDYLIFAILVISFLLILYFGRKRKQSIIITHRKE
jgi:hypothetical protein